MSNLLPPRPLPGVKGAPAKRVKGSRGKRSVSLAPVLAVAETAERFVPNPLAVEPGQVIKVRVSCAHPIDHMKARGRLSDAHYAAAVRFRAIYERAEIGAARGVDFTREAVDGGAGPRDVLTDGVVQAHKDLARIARVLGSVGGRLVERVCGAGVPIETLALTWPMEAAARARMDYLTHRLKEALEVLASEVWGATGPARGRIVGDGARGAFDPFAEDDAATAEHVRRFQAKGERKRAAMGVGRDEGG